MDCIPGLPFFTIVANCMLHKPLSSLLYNIARGSCGGPSADSGQKLFRKKAGLGLEKQKMSFRQLLRCFKLTTPPSTNSLKQN